MDTRRNKSRIYIVCLRYIYKTPDEINVSTRYVHLVIKWLFLFNDTTDSKLLLIERALKYWYFGLPSVYEDQYCNSNRCFKAPIYQSTKSHLLALFSLTFGNPYWYGYIYYTRNKWENTIRNMTIVYCKRLQNKLKLILIMALLTLNRRLPLQQST